MSNKLEELFEPILQEQKIIGIREAFDKLIWTVHNTNEEQFENWKNSLDSKEKYIQILLNIRNELLKQERGEELSFK